MDGFPNSFITQRPGEVGVGDVLGVESEGDMAEMSYGLACMMIGAMYDQ
jgi:hypothetical protein